MRRRAQRGACHTKPYSPLHHGVGCERDLQHTRRNAKKKKKGLSHRGDVTIDQKGTINIEEGTLRKAAALLSQMRMARMADWAVTSIPARGRKGPNWNSASWLAYHRLRREAEQRVGQWRRRMGWDGAPLFDSLLLDSFLPFCECTVHVVCRIDWLGRYITAQPRDCKVMCTTVYRFCPCTYTHYHPPW